MAKKPAANSKAHLRDEADAKSPAKSAAKAGSKGAKSSRAPAQRTVELKPLPLPPAPKPKALDSILGQDRAISVLKSALDSGRIHHAWIFQGPPGVGKFTTALALASVLLGKPGESAALLDAGTHPDLHIVTKELALVSRDAATRDSKQRTLAKEVLEEFLIEPSSRTRSMTGPGVGLVAKVFIVDEAELIDARGQNALLKTLEEPAEGRVIILVTSREERLLPTIRSRCQRVAFAPLSDADMRAWIESSGLDLAQLDAAAMDWLLAFADGSPGMLKLAIDTNVPAWHAQLAPMLAELDRGGPAVDLASTMDKLVEDWAVAWVERPGNDNASKDAAAKAGARLMFRLLGTHARTRLRRAQAPEARQSALDLIDRLADAERLVETNVQRSFVLENLVAQSLAPARP